DGIRDRNVTGVQTCALPICFAPAQPPGLSSHDPGRASPEEPSAAPGLAALALAPLGAVGGTGHGAVVRRHSRKQAAPGDGLSVVSGNSATGPALFERAGGSGRRASRLHRSLFLSECEVDAGTRARPPTPAGVGDPAAAPTPQPSRRRLLRSRRGAEDLALPLGKG